MPARNISASITALAVGLLFSGALLLAVPAFADPPPWAPAHGYRDKHDGGDDERAHGHRYVGYGGVEWANDYGVMDGNCNRAAVGAVVGAGVGGLVGSQVGSRQNRPIAIVIGSVLGAVVGHRIGQNMDDADRGCIGHALELAHEGNTVRWVNERSGVEYIVTPGAQWHDGGPSCRLFSVRASVGGRSRVTDGRACRSGDGAWHVR
jgi:surface antigen